MTQAESQYLNVLLSWCTALDNCHTTSEICNALLDHVLDRPEMDAAAVLLYDPRTERFEYTAGRGFRGMDIERTSLKLGSGYRERAALERRIINIPDLNKETLPERANLVESEEFIGYSSLPLIARGEILGVLEIFRRAPLIETDSNWINFLSALAEVAALAMSDSQLRMHLEQANLELSIAYEATLTGWVHALDLRDRETAGHTWRVTMLTMRLALAMGIGDAELVHMRRGALLHDIGKLGIPDTILYKPGVLTAEERDLFQQHPVLGYQLLAPIQFLGPALDIVYCHHERWDGSGYPRGLRGEEIPLSARIFTVVDVWDALVSERPFRRSSTKEEAIKYIQGQAGLTLDPQVVKAFLTMLQE